MALKLLFYTVIYFFDGLAWISALWLLPEKFFGYPAKKSEKRKWVFLIFLLIYVVMNTATPCISINYFPDMDMINNSPGDISVRFSVLAGDSSLSPVSKAVIMFSMVYEYFGLNKEYLVLGCILYRMFDLKEQNKFKRFAVLFISEEMTAKIINIVSVLLSGFSVSDNKWRAFLFAVVQNIAVISLVCLMSWFSSRKRKEPMRFSLVISSFAFLLFADIVLGLFIDSDISDDSSIVNIRLILENRSDIVSYIGGATVAIMMIFFIVMIVRASESDYFHHKNTVSEYYLETQKEHYASLIESNREIRRIKHDMKNHIYCLKELYDRKNYEELGKYLNEISENIKHADTSCHVGNEIADAIITEKQKKALDKGIAFDVSGDMSGVEISAIDICTIFSNMTDNAIEAADKLSGDDRKITLEIKKNKNFLFISETNPVYEKIEINDDTIATTKKDKSSHGFGIINIKEAAAKYDGECRISTAENMFTIEVMIPI